MANDKLPPSSGGGMKPTASSANKASSNGTPKSPSRPPQNNSGSNPQQNKPNTSANQNNQTGQQKDGGGFANDVKDVANTALNNAGGAAGLANRAKEGVKNHFDNQRVKSADEKQADAQKGFSREFGEKPKGQSLKDGAKDALKDKASEKGKDALKDSLSKGAKNGAKEGAKGAAKEGAKTAATEGVKGAATGAGAAGGGAGGGSGGGIAAGAAGAGLLGGLLALKGWGVAFGAAKAILGSAPVSILHQAGAAIAKGFTAVTNAVNGAINAVTSFLGFGGTAAGAAPTVVVAGVGSTAGTVATINSGIVTFNSDDGNACVATDKNGSDAVSGTVTVASGADSDWEKEGTDANKVAKEVFDYWVGKGFNGAGAAGVLGNVYQESKFNPLAYQNGADTDNPKAITGAIGTNGYGLYQISPGSKYGNWSGFTESNAINQSDYVWEGYGGARVHNGLKNQPDLVKTLGTSPTPEEGAWNWYNIVENGGQRQASYDMKNVRESIARKAYELFGGADIEANESLLSAGGDTASANDNEAKAYADGKADACVAGNDTGVYADGTGSTTAERGKRWRWDDMPEDLKKYAHDPRDMGMSWGTKMGWWKDSGQCVGFSSSYFNLIWDVMEPKYHARGNGNRIAFAYSEMMDGVIDATPRAGAITSIEAYGSAVIDGKKYTGSGSQYGHTQIVQHVFENGDLLIAEQNWPGLSGDTNGTPMTWHFQLMPHEFYATGKIKFFKPDEKKYKLRWTKSGSGD